MIFKSTHLRRLFLMLMLVLGAATTSFKASASHYAAVDLYLTYVGSGPSDLKYKITLVIYKACEPGSISLSTSEGVSFNSSCGTLPFMSLPTIPNELGYQEDTLDQLCANFAPINACRQTNSPWPAFVRRTYIDTVVFPTACTDWKVSWTSGSRNGGIVNLQQPASSLSIYTEVMINNVAHYNNSSPRYLIDPIPYLCQNQPSLFLNGPLDPNNDSLTSSNVQPLDNNATSTIPYNTGYSLANPIASTAGNPYTVNVNTGTATFTPTLTGKFVLAFLTEEYDRFTGVKNGHIRRDVQVSVLNCSAPPPDIDSIPQNLQGGVWVPTPPSGGYVLACPGVPLSFNINASSNTLSNAVFLSANNLVVAPGSVFGVTGNGTANPQGLFQWTPTGADVGDYTIIFTAKDSTCNNNQPIVLKNYFVGFIKVLPGVDAGPDGRICPIEGTPWQINVEGPPSAVYVWTALDGSAPLGLSDPNIPNPTAYPPYNFTYVVTAPNIITACKNKDTLTVFIDTSNSVIASPHDAVLCRPGYFQLNAQGVGLPPLENLQCGTFDIVTCTDEDTLEVRSQYTGGTVNPSTTFTAFPGYRTARMQFLLTKTDLYAYGIRSGTINGIAFDVFAPTPTQYNNMTISLKCTDRTSLSSATGGMENGTTLVYTATGPVAVSPGWNQFTFDSPYSLDSTKNLIIEICYNNATTGTSASVNAVNTGTQQMVITYATGGTANICQNPAIATGTFYYAYRPNVRINYCPADTVAFPFTWTPGNFLSDSTIQSPLAYIPYDTKYYVQTVGRNGCKVRDSVMIHVPIHTYDVWPKDTSICAGESFKMIASGDFTDVKWYESDAFNVPVDLTCDNCREPVSTPKADTRYYAVLTDKDFCSDTFRVNVTVRPLPEVHIINNDTTLKYGQSLQLLVYGGYLYSWQPVSTLTNPNIVNPVATPTQPTTYYVWGLAENGCRNVDSVRVNIDYRDNLFVPSAFTPNGDGKNDVFRVANLTFQRLQEFRVFNRWGQEIFSTTDAKKGWDGTWKGVPQDMGAYQYLIKVAYPDGLIETYKGDVSLVR
jgi:gliding motility-associated-like protein